GIGVDACAGAGYLSQIDAAFGGLGQAVEPTQSVIYVVVLEAGRSKAFGQDVSRRTGLRRVVVFEQINEDIEHMAQSRAGLHSRPAYRQTSKLEFKCTPNCPPGQLGAPWAFSNRCGLCFLGNTYLFKLGAIQADRILESTVPPGYARWRNEY